MQGEDTYDETFSPTSRSPMMRTVIAIATELNYELKHFDICAAFITSDCDRDNIYLAAPAGYEHLVRPGKCFRLKKSLYGLKQASHLYWKKLQTWLLVYGFQQVDDEGTLYRYTNKKGQTMILSMYVDDGLVAASDNAIYEEFLVEFRKVFQISDQGDLHFYLGVKITRDRVKGTTTLSQEQYVDDLLKRFGMSDAKPISSPFDPSQYLSYDDASDRMDMRKETREQVRHYQTIVGALLYLSGNTRPDIAFAVNQAARFMSCPGPSHTYAAKRILRYLRGTKHLSLVFRQGTNKPNVIAGFVDADHAGNPEDRISVSGHISFATVGRSAGLASVNPSLR
jgi:hypothetical protein